MTFCFSLTKFQIEIIIIITKKKKKNTNAFKTLNLRFLAI